ncbi:efflux RND transporter periplasmic adaptor subunit [Verrucomicrobiales bacterium BCK34]|nr:efflux RND transporter periplasmic adaptor subunit [Verrucomicrobiales bacterium BCK34]
MKESPFTFHFTQFRPVKRALVRLVFGGMMLPVVGLLVAQDDAKPVEVTMAKRVEGFSRKLTFTGTVTSPRSANLSSRIEGLVSDIKVDAGSEVKKGDVLVELDTRLAELDLDLINAEIEQARIEVADAERQVKEVRDLARSGGFSRSQAITKEATLSISEANLKRLEARKSHQVERIARHQLVAPFDGVITSKISEAGEWVATGAPVLELIEMKGLRFDLQVPQEFLERVKDIGSVTVNLDAFPGREFQAELEAVVPVKDHISRTFLTRFALKNPEHLASPGMSGTATIETRGTSGKSIQVPRDVVVRFPDGSARVWVVKKEGEESQVVSRTVRTAGELGDMAEILEGLAGDETVVLKGNEGLRENQKVDVIATPLSAP